ncbi:related to RUD3 - suppressor of uso1-1 transport defect [Melanopsichium pennsylvanicum]|uniref:Related to RUD3 - suppressor of uso1-1 transport defect n=2 Tax=Melanopsichium pennsylvanicum TaxID=63383 RepID=A0AAJ5C5X7_9BASI|nr:related to RUD3-suppressor of uso1-1 transport defect [Melanopsichium pennsylvanicum 4]SNX85003.1 related to RUD3 - suppressor of uso1-1 transport defect [Melanopsichium pennsylvanicum]
MSAAASSSSSLGRPSLDAPSTSVSATKATNGTATTSSDDEESDSWAPINTMSDSEIRSELLHVREERDKFQSQYQSLLSKLATMRATLGDRLRQDAEELDRRESQIETLTSKIESLESSTSTLRSELLTSHSETDRLTTELDSLRKKLAATEEEKSTRASADGGRLERQRELHELLERVKLDSNHWESVALEERSKREDLESKLSETQHHLELTQRSEAHHRIIAEQESASAANLSAVLSEFQSTQESELQRALGDHRTQLDTLSTSLSEYKARAEMAESKVEQNAELAAQAEKLGLQVKEKNLLIGKLRHEAVILNEHLTEALRRLRNDQSEANVDKRLVTNLVIQFITTPRADGKRYEMLNLIAGVLGWGEEERELAGLQKSSAIATSGGVGGVGRPSLGSRTSTTTLGGTVGGSIRSISSGHNYIGGKDGGASVGGDESFSNLFVEFLLSEAERGVKKQDNHQTTNDEQHIEPNTPTVPTRLFSPTRSAGSGSEATSPSKNSDVTTTKDDVNVTASSRGGLGSYFGLSRGKK